jgi:hypothetical protein
MKSPLVIKKESFELRTALGGAQVWSISSGVLRVTDAQTGKELGVFKDRKYQSHLSVSDDGALVAVVTTEGKIGVYDAARMKLISASGKARGEGARLQFTPDGAALVSGDWAGDIFLYDIKGKKTKILHDCGGVMIDDVQRIGDTFYFLKQHIADEKSGRIEKNMELLSWAYPFTGEPESRELPVRDGSVLAMQSGILCVDDHMSKKLHVLSFPSLEPLGVLQFPSQVKAAAVSADRKYIAAVADSSAYLYDAESFSLLKVVEEKYCCFAGFTADGGHIMIGSWNAGKIFSIGDFVSIG